MLEVLKEAEILDAVLVPLQPVSHYIHANQTCGGAASCLSLLSLALLTICTFEKKLIYYINKIYFSFVKVFCFRLWCVTFLTLGPRCWGFLTLMHVLSGATGSLDRCSL